MAEIRFDLEDIMGRESMFRRYFMNTIEGFKNAALVGTARADGHTNLAVFNSIVHIGASPPLIGFIHRPVTVPKQTFTNIQATGSYTINLISKDMTEQAHQTSARYAPDVSEFTATGLTPVYGEKIRAPYVAESPVRFGLQLEEILPIRANGTFLVIGKVAELYLPEELIEEDGFVELSEAGLVACAGLDAYYEPVPLARYEYAKPDLPVRKKA